MLRPQEAGRICHIRFERWFFWHDGEGSVVPFKVQRRRPVGRLVLHDTAAGTLGFEQVVGRRFGGKGCNTDQYPLAD